MAEISRPWSGTTIGDSGPYSDNQWADTWRSSLLGNLGANQGVFRAQLNELAATGAVTPVAIDTGRADIQGKWYESDVSVDVAIPTPAAATRIDRIVIRADYTAQTARITRIAGVEGGGVPALVQVAETTWDIPIANVSITVAGPGTITLTDTREFIAAGTTPQSSVAAGSFELPTGGVVFVPMERVLVEGTNDLSYEIRADDTVDEIAFTPAQELPDNWSTGTTITVSVYWRGTAIVGDVVFVIEYLAAGSGDDGDAAYAAGVTLTSTAQGVAERENRVSGTFALTGVALDKLKFSLLRNAVSGSDTFVGDAKITEMRIMFGT